MQKNLGIENGFIEEMMSGQKVVKAFVHEEESMADFDKINEQLFESSYLANRYANVLMPILGNLGNVSFVLTALVGGLFALNGVGGLTIGGIIAILKLLDKFISLGNLTSFNDFLICCLFISPTHIFFNGS